MRSLGTRCFRSYASGCTAVIPGIRLVRNMVLNLGLITVPTQATGITINTMTVARESTCMLARATMNRQLAMLLPCDLDLGSVDRG